MMVDQLTRSWIDVRSFDTLGRKRDGTDDWWQPLQQAIDYLIADPFPGETGTLFLPPGIYRISKPLQIRVKYLGGYSFCSIHIVGDSPGYGAGNFHSSAIVTDFGDGPALVIQSGRAVKLENLTIRGRNGWQDHVDANNVPDRNPGDMATHYDDANYLLPGVRDNRYSPHAGIAIDPYHADVARADRYPSLATEYINTGTGGGSSALSFQNCFIYNFTVGVGISLNGHTANAENISFVDCTFGSVKSAIAVGQDQSRNVTCQNVSIYGSRVAFDCINYGKGSGNCPSIFGANIGGTKYLFQTFPWGGQVAVTGLYAESFYSVGNFGGGGAADPHVLNGCNFSFAPTPPGKPVLDLRMSTSTLTTFNGCRFGMVDSEPMYLYAQRASFNECQFVGVPTNAASYWNVGFPETTSYSNCIMSTTPFGATLDSTVPVTFKSNFFDQPILPGTFVYGIYDSQPPALGWVSGKYPRLDLGTVSVTINPNGTASFGVPAALAGRVAPGDFIVSLTPYFALPAPSQTTPVQLALGKVTAVNGTTITLSHVPKIVVDDYAAKGGQPAQHHLLAANLPRIHPAMTGTMDFAVSATDITVAASFIGCWQINDHIRDKQGLIPEGTYVASINQAAQKLTLSRPITGSGKVTLDLYDAEVRGVALT
jgi:hypothetical protein